jgi:hypothetical protein
MVVVAVDGCVVPVDVMRVVIMVAAAAATDDDDNVVILWTLEGVIDLSIIV